MTQVLEAVPNFSEGRDVGKIEQLVARISTFDVEVLDWSSDPDHHRSVVTFIGSPRDVEAASVEAAHFAFTHFDLSRHKGVHPRVGALDVLPFVPLHGLTMADAVASAHRVGSEIARLGVPVFFYGQAAKPAGRGLAQLRRGGVEALADGWPHDLIPDLPAGAKRPHPTAGVTCVGARPVLLAWNVFVTGVELAEVRRIAGVIRERNEGFAGVRALGLRLIGQERMQISMNLEDLDRTAPLDVFDRIDAELRAGGGQVVETEVIGMIPDTLVLPNSAGKLRLPYLGPARVLSHRVANYVMAHSSAPTETSEIAE